MTRVVPALDMEVEPDHLMTPDELAEYLQMSVRTLYDWQYTRRGPRALKLGKHLRYRRDDVEAWLTDQAAA